MSDEDKDPAIIDLTTLPVTEMIALLRAIGHHLLTCVLDDRQPQLLQHFNQDHARHLVTHLGRTPRPGRQFYAHKPWALSLPSRAGDRLLRLLRYDKRFPFPQTVEMLVSGQLSQTSFTARVGDELSFAMELQQGYRFPADLWDILGRHAWNDLQFRHVAAETLERKMRSRTLFSASLQPQENRDSKVESFPTMHLAPQLFWLLTAMAISTIHFKRSYRILPARRRVRKALLLLQAEGMRQGLQPEWAGLWDQWVLLEAEKIWISEKIPERLSQALADLPLAAFRARGQRSPVINMDRPREEMDQDQGKQPPQKLQIAVKNWADSMPGWFEKWNQLRPQ